MSLNRQSPAAAPPDDGGHQGSYTTPDQTMEMPAADGAPQAPFLHRDLDRSNGAGAGVSVIWLVSAALLLVALAAFFGFAR